MMYEISKSELIFMSDTLKELLEGESCPQFGIYELEESKEIIDSILDKKPKEVV